MVRVQGDELGLSPRARSRVRSEWARRLDVHGDVLTRPGVTVVPREATSVVVTLVLEHSTVVVAPPSAATRLARLNADQLFDIQEVVRVLAGLDPSPIGVASLAYSDSAPREVELEDSFAATDEQVAAFQASVPDEDWEESGLGDMPSRFLGVTERNQVAAMAGIETWGRDIAQIGVCSAPQYRGRGFGRLAAAAAVSAAVRQGSVAQWRCRLGNEPSRRLGQALGFVTLGHQAAVTVESSARA